MASSRRCKYGVFFHPAIRQPQRVAGRYFEGLVHSFTDPFDPSLGSVAVRWEVSLVRVDGSVVFEVHHQLDTPTLLSDDRTGPVRAGILEALDWWNSETILIAPSQQQLNWDGPALPNAWTTPWEDDLVVQTITQYPKRLGNRVLEEWNPGLSFCPFEFIYEPPTPEQESRAVHSWWEQQKILVDAALLEASPAPGGPWCWTTAQRYRNAIAPDPKRLKAVGSREQAEAAAEDYQGPCFLIDASTGETVSRWAGR